MAERERVTDPEVRRYLNRAKLRIRNAVRDGVPVADLLLADPAVRERCKRIVREALEADPCDAVADVRLALRVLERRADSLLVQNLEGDAALVRLRILERGAPAERDRCPTCGCEFSGADIAGGRCGSCLSLIVAVEAVRSWRWPASKRPCPECSAAGSVPAVGPDDDVTVVDGWALCPECSAGISVVLNRGAVDSRAVPLHEFLTDNADDLEACRLVRGLEVGQTATIGGGAFPVVRIRRVT